MVDKWCVCVGMESSAGFAPAVVSCARHLYDHNYDITFALEHIFQVCVSERNGGREGGREGGRREGGREGGGREGVREGDGSLALVDGGEVKWIDISHCTHTCRA